MPPSLRLALILSACAVLLALAGCVGMYPDRLIARQDHAGLALHYAHEARELNEKAHEWETLAKLYEKHPDVNAKAETAQFAERCRTIARHLRQAAEEAETLAAAHQQTLSKNASDPRP
ncbi:MAG: hypothetical protein AB1411_13620 [Nitrospirota bacterium]